MKRSYRKPELLLIELYSKNNFAAELGASSVAGWTNIDFDEWDDFFN